MGSKRGFVVVGAMLGGMTALGVLVGCPADPRDDDAVSVISTCDRTKLSADPTSPESTLLAYLKAADMLTDATTTVEGEIKDACNAIGADLALPAGTDPGTACRPVAARCDAVSKLGGDPVPGFPHWVEMLYPATCKAKPGALEACLSTCGAACDGTKCDPAQQAGTCNGDCTGTCVTTSPTPAPCTGQCVGEFDNQAPATCHGECTGVCTGAAWAASCGSTCAGFFTGSCDGTCTGQCNGQPINVPTTDAGAPDGGDAGDAAAGDAAAADAGDAGAPSMGGPPSLSPPPSNADGNCKGFCVGVCSKGANGFCANSPCLDFSPVFQPDAGPPVLGMWSGGNCAQYDGLCGGHCIAAGGSGTTSTCIGECTEVQKKCAGTCVGGCTGTLANPSCRATPKCNQNAECQNACAATAILSTTCDEPTSIEVYAVSDPVLATALRKGAPKLGKASTEIANLRDVLSNIRGRAYGDFVNIGLRGDLVRACVAEGNTKINAADSKIATMVSVDPSTRKFQQAQ